MRTPYSGVTCRQLLPVEILAVDFLSVLLALAFLKMSTKGMSLRNCRTVRLNIDAGPSRSQQAVETAEALHIDSLERQLALKEH